MDTTITSFKLAETVDLPVMLVLDAFFLSHTSEPVDVPDQALVDEFLPKRKARYKLDIEDPRAFGALVRPSDYMEIRLRQQEAMEEAREVMLQIDREWERLTGRVYRAIELYKAEDAEILIVSSGTMTSTVRFVVNELRAKGEKVGLVKVKMFRPFPTEDLRKVLSGVPRVAVMDRNISPGHGGIFAEEIRSALYDLPVSDRPELYGYIVGLGGRDVTPDVIREIVTKTREAKAAPEREDLWVGAKL
jgi:pyruvate/2-oxoacid:ferredoxin oxidoreductase alpha subunit